MKKVTFFLLLLLPALAGAAHITDRLLAGMYASPDTNVEPIKLLPSGTPLDIIGEKNGLIKIKLVDGKQGWVEKRFLSEQKPAKSRLLVLQSKYKQMQREFDNAKRKLMKLEKVKPANKTLDKSKAVLEKKYASLQAELGQLKEKLKKLQNKKTLRIGEGSLLQEAQAEIVLLKKQLKVPPVLQQPLNVHGGTGFSGWWFLIVVAIVMPAGFAGGLWLQDERQRRRHGGFRI